MYEKPEPDRTEKSFDWEALVGGRIMQIVGMLAVLGGLSYFLKDAVDLGYIRAEWFPPIVRVAAGIMLGVGTLVYGERLARKTRWFGEGIIALGAGILDVSLYAGGPTFGVLPPLVELAGLALVSAAVGAVACVHRSERLAMLGVASGFIAPFLLASTSDETLLRGIYFATIATAYATLGYVRGFRRMEFTAFGLTLLADTFAPGPAKATGVQALAATLAAAAPFVVIPILEARRSTLSVERKAQVLLTAIWLAVSASVDLPTGPFAALFDVSLAFGAAAAASLTKDRIYLWSGLALLDEGVGLGLDARAFAAAVAVEGALLYRMGLASAEVGLRRIAGVLFTGSLVVLIAASGGERIVSFFDGGLLAGLTYAASLAAVVRFARRPGTVGADEAELVRLARPIVHVVALAALLPHVWYGLAATSASAFLSNPQTCGVATTLTLGIYATVLFILGRRDRDAFVRWEALALLSAAALKLGIVDLAFLDVTAKMIALTVFGALALGVSAVYRNSARGANA